METTRKEVLITDFDGTLAWLSLPYSVHHWMLRHRAGLIFLIPFIPLAFVGYLLRPPKKTAKRTILEHRNKGGRVVVFSSTENLWITRLIIWSWLKVWRVPIDRLALRPRRRSTENFKAEVLLEEGCSVLLENETPIIVRLVGEMLQSGFRNTSITTQQHYSRVLFHKGGGVT
ncbi:hypothetical protein KJ562_02125 [Patescibacteria group bacterium]|nr:hypothetical protein [Patescibacteria group bacterium]